LSRDLDTRSQAPANPPADASREPGESPSEPGGGSLLPALNDLLRKSVNQIADGTRLLMESQLPPELGQILARIDDSTRTLSQITSLIMDQWMAETGAMRPASIDFDLRTTLGEARRSIRRMARETGNDVETRFDPAIPGSFSGDPSRLRQIIFDLAGFLMFQVKDETILWECAREADDENEMTLRVSFSTTSVRMDDDAVRRAFEREGLSLLGEYQGTGSILGPYHAKMLARMLSGDAGFEHDADRLLLWATVVLKKRAPSPAAEAMHGRRVLFVSSSPKEVRAIIGTLEERGWDARGATTQREAVALLRDSVSTGQPCSIILVTAVLPDGGGDELAREAFAILGESRVHVVMIADVGRTGDAEWARRLGLSAFLVRPLSPRTLHGVCSELHQHSERHGGDAHGIFLTRHSMAERNERKMWVLVVDDDTVSRLSISSAVQSLGHEVYGAESASQALELYDRALFDLILMDIRMQDLDGDHVALLLRSRERAISQRPATIIGITSNPGPDDRQRCLACGMNDLLPKPIGVDTITSIIDSMKPEESLVCVWQPLWARGADPSSEPGSQGESSKPSLAAIMGLGPGAGGKGPDETGEAAAA
jgi:CheY-like chemotaxis protein